jgi:hypothetical protein
MPGITDLIGKLHRMMNSGAAETYDPATGSLEALANTMLVAANIAVPGADVATNTLMRDPIGNKTDAAVYAASLVASLMAYAKGNLTLANYIYNLANSIQTLTETGGTITTTVALGAMDIWHVAAPMGVFKPIALKLDCSAMAAADEVHVSVYERIVAGGGPILSDTVDFANVQAIPLKTISLDPNRFGIEITIHETAGAGTIAFSWAVIFEI